MSESDSNYSDPSAEVVAMERLDKGSTSTRVNLVVAEQSQEIYNSMRRRHKFVLGFFIFCAVWTFLMFFNEANSVITGLQRPLFSLDQISTMIAEDTYAGPRQSTKKVLLVILDGLRADYAESNTAMQAVFNDPAVAPDLYYSHSYAEIPTISIPNWTAFISGCPPEVTGTLGNVVQRVNVDHIYRAAQRHNVSRGLMGFQWWFTLLRETLMPLNGDAIAAVDDTQMDEYGKLTYSGIDIKGAADTVAAEATGSYALFLTHLSNIDEQGHNYGVTTQFNTHDTYNLAVTNMSVFVASFFQAVDNNTIVIVSADHGHYDTGGHGGPEEVLREIPLAIYAKGTGIGTAARAAAPVDPFAGTRDRVRTRDIASTMAAIIGVPPPRQNLGVPIPVTQQLIGGPAWDFAVAQLNRQLRSVVGAFVTQDNYPTKKRTADEVAALDSSYNPDTDTTANNLARINTLRTLYANARTDSLEKRQAQNILVTVFLGIFACIVIAVSLQQLTAIDFLALCRRDATNEHKQANVRGFVQALGIFTVGYLLALAVHNIVYAGYHLPWSRSQWNTTATATDSFLLAFLLGFPSFWLVFRVAFAVREHFDNNIPASFEAKFDRYEDTLGCCYRGLWPLVWLWRRIRLMFYTSRLRYATAVYFLFITNVATAMLFMIESPNWAFLPTVLQTIFFEVYYYSTRVRLVVAGFLMASANIVCVFILRDLVWGPDPRDNTAREMEALQTAKSDSTKSNLCPN